MKKIKYSSQALAYILSIFLAYFICCSELAAVEVVVNKTVPAYENSIADIRAIFTLKKRAWPNGKAIQVYTLADGNPLHVSFVKNILHMLPYHMRRIWDRVIFSGTGAPPIELNSEEEMIDKVAQTPNSIGYVTAAPKNDDLHVLDYQ